MRIAVVTTLGLILVCSIAYQLASDSTAATSSVANLLFRNNLHEVSAGKLYRSSQMSRAALGETIDRMKLKSVIDLRIDEDAPDSTGKTESQAAAEHGAQYRHIPFSSAKAAQRRSLLALLDAYDEMPRPVLVHCSSGTHRSGVASALWLIAEENATPEEALRQLSVRYGYFQAERDLKSWWTGRPTLDRVLTEFDKDHKRSGIALRDWLEKAPLVADAGETPAP